MIEVVISDSATLLGITRLRIVGRGLSPSIVQSPELVAGQAIVFEAGV